MPATAPQTATVVLIIDDEAPIRRLLRIALETEGCTVCDAADGRAGLAEAVFRHPDVIILDLEPETTIFTAGAVRMDFAARRVFRDDVEVHLTATEYALLRVLARNEGKVVTQRQLLREVWGPKAEERSQYLRVYMNHLRRKLDPTPGEARLIRTEPGIGYRLVAPE